MIYGIDVWNGYAVQDWERVAQQIKFVYVRLSDGVGKIGGDPKWKEFFNGAQSVGLSVGFYVVPPPSWTSDPVDYINRVVDLTDGHGIGSDSLPLAIDVELPDPDGTRIDAVKSLVGPWCAAANAAWLDHGASTNLVCYTYPYYAGKVDLSRCSDMELWMATIRQTTPYTPVDGQSPILKAPWKDWAIWQYSANASVPVDGMTGVGTTKGRAAGTDALDRDCMRDETFYRLARISVEPNEDGHVFGVVPTV